MTEGRDRRRGEQEGAIETPEVGTRLSAREIHENIRRPAERELDRPAASLLWSAVGSGLIIGFSFLAAAFAARTVPEPYAHAAAAAAYPLGFIFVIMARSELFTENTLAPVIPFLERRDWTTFVKLVRVWALLLLGNHIGVTIIGWAFAATPVVEPALHPALLRIAREATEGGFARVLYAGVFGGWLIALLAWLLATTQSTGAQIAFIWLCTAPIAAFRFSHSVASSVEAVYRAVRGDAAWGEMLGGFVVPSVIGNAIGGVLLVALVNYGQVASEPDEDREPVEDASQQRRRRGPPEHWRW